MEQTTLNRVKIELQSFKGLVISNLIGGALALAFSLAYAVPKLIPLLVEGTLSIEQIPYLGLTFIGFVVGINWIARSAELMDEHDDIVQELEDVRLSDDEAIINVIIQSLAFYRENQSKIHQLGIGSRIVGAFLLITAIPQLQAIFAGDYPFGIPGLLGQWFGLVASIGIGLAGFYIPTLIKKFTEKWDARLNSIEKGGKELGRLLKG
jgi:hypothetical protein